MTREHSHVRLFIFDADGTLRWSTGPGRKYPLSSGEWRLTPGVEARLRAIPWSPRGPWLAVASNQNGVAAGELSEERARELITDMLRAALGSIPEGTRVELCICAEHLPCGCREPAPGLPLRLLDHFGVSPGEALFVGDLDFSTVRERQSGRLFSSS